MLKTMPKRQNTGIGGKLLAMILIIAVITGHIILFYYFFADKDKNNTTENTQKETTVNTAKNELSLKPVNSNKTASVAEPLIIDGTVKPTESTSVTHKNNQFFPATNPGTPFDYSTAVEGSLKKLPNSNQVKSGILIDLGSRKVIWAKNPKKAVPIASMTKMMTTALLFEAIEKDPAINFDTPVKVSKEAYKIGGSQVWLDPRETFPLRELLKAMVIKSANDAAFLIGQYLGGGSIESFVAKMNKHAAELGMTHTNYINPHGLPSDNRQQSCKSSAEDQAILAEHLLQHSELLKLNTTKLGYFRGKKTFLYNTNKLLLRSCQGLNGMKTGFTRKAGFCITATVRRNNKTMVAVVTGMKSSKDREKLVNALFNWGEKK